MIENKVTPVEECPMCGEENIRLIDICPVDNPDHKICQNCVIILKEKYDKLFCAYCGERPAIINKSITITSLETVDFEQAQTDTPCQIWKKKYQWLLNILCGILSYIGLIYNWHLYRMIDHYIEEGEVLDKDVDWHIYNAFYALFIDACLAFFVAYICENRWRCPQMNER